MAHSVKKFREIVFQLVYSHNFEKSDREMINHLLMRQHHVPKKVVREAKEKADSIWEKKEELDREIQERSIKFDFEKIGKVEIAILRLGLYEILYLELDLKIAISEAVRLTRKFSTKEGAGFVNAVLDKEMQSAKEPATI